MNCQVRPNLFVPALSGFLSFWALVIPSVGPNFQENAAVGLVLALCSGSLVLYYWKRLSGIGRAISIISLAVAGVTLIAGCLNIWSASRY